MNSHKYRQEQQAAEDEILGISKTEEKALKKALRKERKRSLVDAQERLRLGKATPEDIDFLASCKDTAAEVNPENISLAARLRNQITTENLTIWFPFPKPPEDGK